VTEAVGRCFGDLDFDSLTERQTTRFLTQVYGAACELQAHLNGQSQQGVELNAIISANTEMKGRFGVADSRDKDTHTKVNVELLLKISSVVESYPLNGKDPELEHYRLLKKVINKVISNVRFRSPVMWRAV
jgi:hypothetical protein